MIDDEEKRPEEEWAQEMAEDNYNPEDDDNIEDQSKAKRPKNEKNKFNASTLIDSYAAQNQTNTSVVEPNIDSQNEMVVNSPNEQEIIEQLTHPIIEVQEGYPQFLDFMADNQIKQQEVDHQQEAQPIDMPQLWYVPPQEFEENAVGENGNGDNAEDNEVGEVMVHQEQIQPNPQQDLMDSLEELDERLVLTELAQSEEVDNSVEIYDNRNIEQLLRGEHKEYNQKLKEKFQNRKRVERVENPITDCLKRGLIKHNEPKEMQNIKKLLKNQKNQIQSKQKPFYGRAHIRNLNYDEVIQLFKRFTFQGQFVLSTVCPQWNEIMSLLFIRQKYLWFTNEEKRGQRFLPIEVCCETCRHEIDCEPLIRVTDNLFLLQIIDKMLVYTNNLKCLRLYRFEFNRLLIVKKLRRNCGQLKHLDLTECYDLRLDVIKELAFSYPFMAHLILSSTNLDEEMLNCLLIHMRFLETLNVSSTDINGHSFRERYVSKELKRLDIRCCSNITIDNILDFMRFFGRHLKHLKMDSYDSREVYRQISLKFNSLILLEINEYESKVLSAGQLLNELIRLTRLQSLKIGKNVALNNILFLEILQNCKQIRNFSYEFSDFGENSITEANLMEIGVQWPRLERLELINNRKIGTHFISSLFAFKNLNYLNLTQSPRLMDEEFANGLRHLPYLSCLILDKCHNLGKSTLDAVIIKANRMTNQELVVSMNCCNFTNIPYLKSKLVPKNLRITYSSIKGKTYHTFDGKRIKCGKMSQIIDFLNGK